MSSGFEKEVRWHVALILVSDRVNLCVCTSYQEYAPELQLLAIPVPGQPGRGQDPGFLCKWHIIIDIVIFAPWEIDRLQCSFRII